MNIYYCIGFLVGIIIGLIIITKYLPPVNKILKEKKQQKKELENESNSSFDID
jgi:uncharacterized membrane-anchored protein YhcB (DUF1043 family)